MKLPIRRYAGPVHLVLSAHDVTRALHDIRQERVVGFDTETRPVFKRGVTHQPSLVQVATARAAHLVRLRYVDCAAALTEVLGNPHLIKTGIALADDLRQLKSLFPFEAHNVVDLGTLAQRHGLQQTGLRNLAGMFLRFRLTKGPQTSNWERPELSGSQITYAATDAWACRELFLHFENLGWLRPPP
jgi:ribonuclease D